MAQVRIKDLRSPRLQMTERLFVGQQVVLAQAVMRTYSRLTRTVTCNGPMFSEEQESMWLRMF